MFAGNQGYQVDGELVKAGLILPLDEYAKAYGWDESYTPETLQQFEWSEDGQSFGEGTLWGVAQSRPVDRRVREHGEAQGRRASTPRR